MKDFKFFLDSFVKSLKIKQLFNSIDNDKNGFINIIEFKQQIKCLNTYGFNLNDNN